MSGVVSRRTNNVHLSISVTPFLNKLYSMVNDSSSDDLIRWSEDGSSFVVVRREEFAKDVLPRFFKHSNFSSFVRQLNMYGFHKVPHLQQGGLIADGPDAERWEFNNDNFRRGQQDLLHFIRRKKNNRDSTGSADGAGGAEGEALQQGHSNSDNESLSAEGVAPRIAQRQRTPQPQHQASAGSTPPSRMAAGRGPEADGARARPARSSSIDLAKVLKEIQVIRDHQMTISSDIKRLQEENQSLWMQAHVAEERYSKHQETINKILRFLATIFSDTRQSEIRPPLRRLISHTDTRPEGASRGRGSGAEPMSMPGGSNTDRSREKEGGTSSSWTQNVFEEMDFPDILANSQPPDKRQRMNEPGQVREMHSGAPSPPPPPDHAGDNVLAGEDRVVRRKRSSPQHSTALTRTRPIFGTPAFSRYNTTNGSDAETNNVDDNRGTLGSSLTSMHSSQLVEQARSIEDLQKNLSQLDTKLEGLTQSLQTGLLQNGLSVPGFSTAAAGYPQASSANFLNSAAASQIFDSTDPITADHNTPLDPEVLKNLVAYINESSRSTANHASLQAQSHPGVALGSNDVGTILPWSSDPGSGLRDAFTASMGAGLGTGAAAGSDARAGSSASAMLSQNDQMNILQQIFAEAQSGSSDLRPFGYPNSTHLLTDNTDGSIGPLQAESTPFLDFVDPDAGARPDADTSEPAPSESTGAKASSNHDPAQALLSILESSGVSAAGGAAAGTSTNDPLQQTQSAGGGGSPAVTATPDTPGGSGQHQ
ncbi:Heat shock transcription factor [Coemansia sp. RSA 552]|nr:Heat shock transcription factor [Coemansia sp. RSA 552]